MAILNISINGSSTSLQCEGRLIRIIPNIRITHSPFDFYFYVISLQEENDDSKRT
jgi:hypothetical protein